LFDKYGKDNDEMVESQSLHDLIDKCKDCREAYEHMVNNCFRNGASSARTTRLKEIQDMEEEAKKTLSSKESRGLLK
jgi:hypothetical protein